MFSRREYPTFISKFDSKSIADKQSDMTSVWLPYTLRWPFLSSTILYTIALELTVMTIHLVSARNLGLTDDNKDNLKGTKTGLIFLPTFLAVIHNFLISILLNDIKRTEPFAQLASSSGAAAKVSLALNDGAWWNALAQSLPSRKNRTNWAMFGATIAFMLGFLIISPFSSTLLTSQETLFTRDTSFFQLDNSPSQPLQATPLSTTYFRTIANVLQNVTTSAWTTDKYSILPFRPSDMDTIPLGPIIPGSPQTWSATTTIFNVELDCEHMNITHVAPWSTYNSGMPWGFSGTSIIAITPSGCTLNLSLSYDTQLLVNGGTVWHSLYNLTVDDFGNYADYYFPGYVETTSCTQDEMVMISDEWYNWFDVSAANAAFTGLACKTNYYMGDSTVTVTLTQGKSFVEVNEPLYLSNRVPLPTNVANISTFQNAFLSRDWVSHMTQIPLERTSSSSFLLGPGNLLAALYDYSPGQMVQDPFIGINAQKLKQRFFGELLRDIFTRTSSNSQVVPISGTITDTRRRVIVVRAIAIVLEISLAIQIVLLIVVWIATQAANRPLGLSEDPAPALNMARLLEGETSTLNLFKSLHSVTSKKLESTLSGRRFHISCGRIYQVPDSGVKDFDILDDPGSQTQPPKIYREKQSFAFGFGMIMVLGLLLSLILGTIIYLYWYSTTNYGMYQTVFVYSFNISMGSLDLNQINPASVITTLVASVAGLWWGSLDTVLRKTQPFIALASEPVKASECASLSYTSSYMLWASWKAARRNHWVLMLMSLGAFLSEICKDLYTLCDVQAYLTIFQLL